ncbi:MULTISPECIES: hypothetical protein [Micromonospora]|uniref:Uncharacterized protein n=1 Tax=Micromonospora yangpuensis TaxID=683228 RepID=A0A1C6UFA8_9ACTN|nr:hypothetical protein [Micromonospora yangpuensis]GGM05865.1 hypothetical protein GCM10012279_24520 [Micromonospora yangpuensis]SCL52662.1 hypothetical protein GA0070617_2144 [Micromonospora yangpuensis]
MTAHHPDLLDRLRAAGHQLPGTDAEPLGERLLDLQHAILRTTLDHAVRHLDGRHSEGASLLAKPQLQAQLADIAVELRESGLRCEIPAADPARLRWARHQRLTATGRRLLRLLGATSMLADGPGGDLHLVELLGNAYLHPGSVDDHG